MKPQIIVHGGAWDWPDSVDAAKHAGVREAASIGYQCLIDGGSAVDAVERAVNSLEDCPAFDAATGGYLNQEGIVQLDALIVDGSSYDFGAVGGASRIKNPISLARRIMESTEYCFFVGEGADRMAAKLGIPLIPNIELVTPEMHEYFKQRRTDGPKDTVGAVAIDAQGNVAAATSTSGTPYKPAGRVGDSPLLGAGGYAQNGIGTCGATGHGENIMRVLLSKYTCDQMMNGLSAQDAAVASIAYIDELFAKSMSGVIVIDSTGQLGAAHSTPKLAHGWIDADGKVQSSMLATPF